MRICNRPGRNCPACLLVRLCRNFLSAPPLRSRHRNRGTNMRMRLLTLVAAVGLGAAMAQSASAADLSLPPPVYRAPPPTYFTWTGWYIGLNGGGGWGQTSHTATVNAIGLPP